MVILIKISHNFRNTLKFKTKPDLKFSWPVFWSNYYCLLNLSPLTEDIVPCEFEGRSWMALNYIADSCSTFYHRPHSRPRSRVYRLPTPIVGTWKIDYVWFSGFQLNLLMYILFSLVKWLGRCLIAIWRRIIFPNSFRWAYESTKNIRVDFCWINRNLFSSLLPEFVIWLLRFIK